jgi:hypothetical protein
MSTEPHKRVSWPLDPTTDTKAVVEPARAGDWCQTASGAQFWPLDPRPEEVSLTDIATALSNLCRFGGQLDNFYSVAQHSVLVCLSLPQHLRAQGLLHDAAEAYLVDVPRPIKRYLVNYGVFEARIAACIGDRFGVELCELDPLVELADNRALATEKRDLLVNGLAPWRETVPHWQARISPWEPHEARRAFLALAQRLGIR